MRRVLIIDENKDSLSANEIFFSGKGYVLQSAQNSNQALHKISLYEFDCILTDLIFSDIQRVSLYQHYKKKGYNAHYRFKRQKY